MEEFIKIGLVRERYLGGEFFFIKIGFVRERYLGEFFLSKLD